MATTFPSQVQDSDSTLQDIERNSNLPAYARNVLPEVRLPSLTLISHGHSPPLNPPPHLKFDVRNLPNPPKHIRDAYNGTSRRLQEWMESDERFIERRDAIKLEIEREMRRITGQHEKEDGFEVGDNEEEMKGMKEEERMDISEDESDEDEDHDEQSSVGTHDDQSKLRVGIVCAMGRHRSVAMVETLAKLSWPGWEVIVEHRDMLKKRGTSKKDGGKRSRGTRGGGIDSCFDDE